MDMSVIVTNITIPEATALSEAIDGNESENSQGDEFGVHITSSDASFVITARRKTQSA
jgi:hypothetical protein